MIADRTDIISLLHLRILVLALGETPECGWWKSRFLSTAGLSFLGRLYPRSDFAAAVRSAVRAAKPVHDLSIGVGHTVHLFRLPSDLERKLDRLLQDQQSEWLTTLSTALGNRDQLLVQLGMFGNFEKQATTVGPLRLGNLSDIRRSDTAPRLAGAYYAAFRDSAKVYPYFEGEGKRG